MKLSNRGKAANVAHFMWVWYKKPFMSDFKCICPTLTVLRFRLWLRLLVIFVDIQWNIRTTEALKIAKSLVKTFSTDITIVVLLVQGFLYRTHIKCPTFAASPLVFALSAELYPENHCTTHINCGHFYFLCLIFQKQKRPHQWYNG
jgi:hypothetical protein